MEKWKNFVSLIEGLGLFDAIESFFNYAESINADVGIILEGVDYLINNDRPIMAMLISMEMILATLPEDRYHTGELDPAIIAYAKIKDLMNGIEHENATQILRYLSEFRNEYPRAFAILDDKAGNA